MGWAVVLPQHVPEVSCCTAAYFFEVEHMHEVGCCTASTCARCELLYCCLLFEVEHIPEVGVLLQQMPKVACCTAAATVPACALLYS
jgi:hypothetical protein